MKIKAIIFDLDGTIINSEHIWQKASELLIHKKSDHLSTDHIKDLQGKLCGLGMFKACTLIKNVCELTESVEDLMEEKTFLAATMYKDQISFIDGFQTFHTQINELNLRTGIATNADDTTLDIAKETLKLEQFFGSHIYGISKVGNICKPDPAIYLHVANKLNVDPKDCIAIEDSAHGIAAAQAAGMKCIGITTSNNERQTEHADIIVDTYKQINLSNLLN